MATKIQLRRGTAAEWTAASVVSPAVVLSAGEVGFETDTGKFKIGDGQSYWPQLSYAATLPSEVTTLLSNHASDTTNIHGISDTANLVYTSDLSSHNNATTSVHGISNTAELETLTGSQAKADNALLAAIAHANSIAQGLDVKQSVLYRIDGTVDTTVFDWLITPGQLNKPALGGGYQGNGTRVLITNAVMAGTDYSGIYVLQDVNGFWMFVPTSDGGTNLNPGAFTFVEEGTSAGKGYVLANGTWSQFSDAGSYINSVSTNLLVTPTGMLDLGPDVVTTNGTQTLSNKTIDGILTFGVGSRSEIFGANNDLNISGDYLVNISSGNSHIVLQPAPGSSVKWDSDILATQTYVGTQISNLIDSAPGALNTLNELAAAINDDSSYAATVTNALSLKASIDYVDSSISDLNNNLSNTLGSYVQSGEVGLPDGVASLDSTGKIPASQLPATTGGAEAAVHPFALI